MKELKEKGTYCLSRF